MSTFRLIGIIHDMDIEIDIPYDMVEEIAPIVLIMKNAGMKPKPRFSGKDNAAFEPFTGKVETIEPTKTQNGKDMFIANVRPDVKEGEAVKPLFAVKYMPPKSTWRVGDIVNVSKNDKGWAEMHESEQADPF